MSKILTVVGWTVQPDVRLIEDGRSERLPVDAVYVDSAQWDIFKGGGDQEAIDQLRAQVEEPKPPPKPPRKQRSRPKR